MFEDVTEYARLESLESVFPDVDVLLASGTVKANIGGAKGGACHIYAWWSMHPEQGNTNTALEELRRMFDYITVVDSLNDPYWEHQRGKGLIDEIER